jgi:hypothetical protein
LDFMGFGDFFWEQMLDFYREFMGYGGGEEVQFSRKKK